MIIKNYRNARNSDRKPQESAVACTVKNSFHWICNVWPKEPAIRGCRSSCDWAALCKAAERFKMQQNSDGLAASLCSQRALVCDGNQGCR